MAIVDERSMVMVPIVRATSMTVSEAAKNGKMRLNMYTPAATIVAEWSSALTGVGPSMASGNHVSSGNWALLPITPQKMRSPDTVQRSWGIA